MFKHGVILAGGTGSRLGLPHNKHVALVHDRPMIHYPMDTLEQLGCAEAIVVTSPESLGDIKRVTQSHPLPSKIIIQAKPLGAPDALAKAENYVGDLFPVLCGDVYLDKPLRPAAEPTLFWSEFPEAINHSVWNSETNEIIEKPKKDIGRRAIIAYVFDKRVFEVIKGLSLSERGEYEMVDIYRYYLANGVNMQQYTGKFVDMGTPGDLLKTANLQQLLNRR